MLKIVLMFTAAASLFFSAWASADGGHHHGHHGHHHGHHGHHHDHWRHHGGYVREYIPVERVYYGAPVPYYAPPVVQYAPVPVPAPRIGYYDQRTGTGLVGGVVGGVVGYELGGGDPLATGIGAAAGALIGNGGYR